MENERKSRRFLVMVRGVLHIEAESGDEANRKAGEWIAAVGEGQPAPADPGVALDWLRIEPFEADNPGFRRERPV